MYKLVKKIKMKKELKSKIAILLIMFSTFIGVNYCAYADGNTDTQFTYSVGGNKYNQEFTTAQTKRESTKTLLN